MPTPTTSPLLTFRGLSSSSVSSQMTASPKALGVAEARTYSQRGVMTAVPNEMSLGFTRCTRIPFGTAAVAERKLTMFKENPSVDRRRRIGAGEGQSNFILRERFHEGEEYPQRQPCTLYRNELLNNLQRPIQCNRLAERGGGQYSTHV